MRISQSRDCRHSMQRCRWSPGRAEVWPLEEEDVTLAWRLHEQHPALAPRDLCHLASCRRRGVSEIKTFDRALGSIDSGRR